MKNRYKDCWEDILSMCDTHLYLGINDDFTAQYCSRFLGNTTLYVKMYILREMLCWVKCKVEEENC